MIVPRQQSWLAVIFHLGGTTLVRTWRRLLVVTIVSVAVTVLHVHCGYLNVKFTATPFTLVGFALSIFLGFRNNTSYDRFWEGRKLWGRMVNTSRSIARQIVTLVASSEGEEPEKVQKLRLELVHQVAGYVHAFRMHLRDEEDHSELEAFLPEELYAQLPAEKNRPIAILTALGRRFRTAYDDNRLHAFHLVTLEQSLTDLTDIQGGCERIKSTPIPFTYTVLIHRIVGVYCLTLPFGLFDTVGYFTPIVSAFVSYAFFGLDAVGDEIEDPFGKDPNDLPLGALSRMIEVNVRQTLGETELPALAEPVDEILS